MLILPKTKISFTIPQTQYNLKKVQSNIDLGVIPDISLENDPYRIIHQNDNYLDPFKDLIKK